MKKLIFMQVFFVLCIIGAFAQMKVMNDGRVSIRGMNPYIPMLGDVQVNIRSGDNNGFCVYDQTWWQTRLKVTGDDGISILDFPLAGQIFAFALNETCIGDKNRILTGYGGFGGTVNIFQKGLNYSALSTITNAGGLAYYNHLYGSGTTFYITADGTAYSKGAPVLTSDATLKKDIETIQSPLEKIVRLNGISYRMKNSSALTDNQETGDSDASGDQPKADESGEKDVLENRKNPTPIDKEMLAVMAKERAEKKQFGFIAQDVEELFPDLVYTTLDGTKGMNYIGLIAILAEGMKEQQLIIESQAKRLSVLEEKLADIESALLINNNQIYMPDNEQNLSSGLDNLTANTGPTLFQNYPNPFSTETEIRFFLPNEVKQAYICIFDMQGTMLKKTNNLVGQSTLVIQGSELKAGMYLYSLIADGKEVDTRKMILTQ